LLCCDLTSDPVRSLLNIRTMIGDNIVASSHFGKNEEVEDSFAQSGVMLPV
jgi:hypothetical protein